MKAADSYFDVFFEDLTGDGKENTYLHEKIFDNKVLERLRMANSQALEGMDVLFLGHHFKYAFAKFLKANNVDPRLVANYGVDRHNKRIAVPMKKPPHIVQKAAEYGIMEAQKATYRDANSFSKMLNQIRKHSRTSEVFLDAIAPFRTTPVNIIRRGFEYSPIGLAKGAYELYQLKNGSDIPVSQVIDTFLNISIYLGLIPSKMVIYKLRILFH